MSGRAGEIALVTGGARGIGLEVVRRLAAEGMTVFLGARTRDTGARAARDIAGDVRCLQLDVTDHRQVSAAVDQVREECGRLDALVNNAGVRLDQGMDVGEVEAGLVQRTHAVNVLGAVAMTQACLPLLRRGRPGRVVNVSSALGSLTDLSDFASLVGQRASLAYSSSKAALNALTLVYARALAPEGILVNAADPGPVVTAMNPEGVIEVEEGAETPVRLALLESRLTGRFFAPSRPGAPLETFMAW
jgi:NAD(P)-dependent dehydrogenase (short-subunit alcohol dehydrogenase family)